MSSRESPEDQAVRIAAAIHGVSAAAAESNAAVAACAVLDRFRAAAETLARKGPGQRAGDLFEWIVTAKFNAEAERGGHDFQAYLTRELGLPHAAEDLLIRQRNVTLKKVQIKVYHDLGALVRKVSDPKYRGLHKLIPKDLVDEARALAQKRAAYYAKLGDPRAIDYLDTAQRVGGDLELRSVRVQGASLHETEFAASYPDLYAAGMELEYLGRAVLVSGLEGAATGALLGGSVAAARQIWNTVSTGVSFADALGEACADALGSGAKAGLTSASGTVLRHAAQRIGNRALARSDVAAGAAAGLIEAGATALAYVRGEITAVEASERFTLTACGTLSNIFAGAAAGAVFGPAGAAIGGVVGCLLATEICASCLAIARGARLAMQEARRLEDLYVESTRALVELRAEVASMFDLEIVGRSVALMRAFEQLDTACEAGNADGSVDALVAIVAVYGRSLRFATFEEFDEFMVHGTSPLEL